MEKERDRIERMLREGKITKEQSEELLKALEESVAKEKKIAKGPKRKIIAVLTAIVALVVIGGLLTIYLPKAKLQRKIDREIPQLGTGDQFKALNTLIKIGEPAVPALIEVLQDKGNPFTRRWEAAKALGAIKDERAAEPLIKAMSDENEVVRRVTAEALGKLGDKKAIPVLKETLKDPKYYYDERTGINRYYTRESAAEALEKLGIEVVQRGNEYIVAGQELQKRIGGGKIVGQYYIHGRKGYKIGIPPEGWNPTFARPLDIIFRNKKGGGWMGTGAYTMAYIMSESFSFEEVNDWWIKGISAKYGWTDIKILEEKELTIAGFNAKLVTSEFTSKGKRNVDMTYHIWKPEGKYDLYRIRTTCRKDKLEEFLPAYKNFVNSFSFL